MVLADRGVGGDLPVRLGGAAVTHRGADGFDVYVDGIPFLLAISDQVAFTDKTAEWKKQQFDASGEPGEQTLSDWWSRSQISFHSGVGQKYLDSYADSQDAPSRTRCDTAFNLEMSVPGEVTVLPAAETILPQTGGIGAGFVFPFTGPDGYRWVFATDGADIKFWRETSGPPIVGAVNHGSAFTIRAAATDGQTLFVASEGGVFKVDSSLTPVKIYDIPSTAEPKLLLGWAKARLMLAVDRTVYELSPAPASTTLPDPLYSHPTPGWEWTAFAEGLTSILAAGHAGPVSQIMEFALADSGGGAPILGGGQVAATMPHGEICYAIENHSGSMIGFGTSKGVRVGQYDSYYGRLSYGPLSIETARPVRALTSQDRFLYAGIESMDGYSSCLGKVDLGVPIDQAGRYAWTPNQPPPALTQAPIRFVTTDEQGLLAFNVDGVGVVRQNPAALTALPAFLNTSRVRMGTLESKAFRYVQVRGELDPGESVTVTASTTAGALAPTEVFSTNVGERFAVGAIAEWCSLRLEVAPGGKLSGYTLYALPAQRRYRTMQIPVWVANSEKNRAGRTFSSPRWAQERYTALRDIESRGDEVELRLPGLGYDVARGVIEEITFVQPHPPTDRGANGMAGVAQITFRTTR
jgi:hypothetical protein